MRISPTLVIAATILVVAAAIPGGPARDVGATHSTPTFDVFVGPAIQADGAGEPSIGFNPATGNALLQVYTKTFRVSFSGTPTTATWDLKRAPTSVINIDPILFTDQATGRTFAGGLNGECSILSYTEDDGNTWTQMTNSCAGTFDHQTIGSGPWRGGTPTGATHDRAVYYCAQNGYASCATSWTGGLTFNNPIVVLGACGGLHGHVKVGPDGTAYLPFKRCSGRAGLGYTLNNGLTWNSRVLPTGVTNGGTPANGFDPSVAITDGNVLYFAWQGQNNQPMVAVSNDGGVSYTNVRNLANTVSPSLTASTFQAVVAGADDRAAVAYLGTDDTGNPFASGFTGEWDLYVSFTHDGGNTWKTVKVTTDPVQKGWICAGGVSCGAGRNLLDFMDATVDDTGRVLVGYADGCINTCATGTGLSNSARATIARQSGGLLLW